MKVSMISWEMIWLFGISLVYFSCDQNSLCDAVICANNGALVETETGCECDCLQGYASHNCGEIDLDEIQHLLMQDVSPFDLISQEVAIDSFYGKMYKGGLIFYLDTNDQTGMVAGIDDQSMEATMWGCWGSGIPGLKEVTNCVPPVGSPTHEEGSRIGDGPINTNAILAFCAEPDIAASQCREMGGAWFLPSRNELKEMYLNLAKKGKGNFRNSYYWSSTQNFGNGVCTIHFGFGVGISSSKIGEHYVRAVKNF